MAEIVSSHQVVAGIESTGTSKAQHSELIEILEAIVLALVAVAAAWSGYQTGLWDGHQAKLYGISAKERAVSNRAAIRGGQERIYDATLFSFWLQEQTNGRATSAERFAKRFRPEFVPAFDAWMATDPFHNANAPPGPTFMPQYRLADERKAAVNERRAAAAFEHGTAARETGDHYLRATVLLATVLFVIALAQRFRFQAVRLGLFGLSAVLLLLALAFIATYPRA